MERGREIEWGVEGSYNNSITSNKKKRKKIVIGSY
jgi:hypothetical protein